VKLKEQQVVEDFSARIGDAFEGVDRIPADHREMVRFNSAKETGYKRVLDVVETFVAEASVAVNAGRLPKHLTANGV